MKKSFAVDKRFLGGILIIFMSFFVIKDLSHNILGVLTIATFDLIIGTLILMNPNYYVADSDGITIYHLIFIRNFYKWNEIEEIKLNIDRGYKTERHKVYLLITTDSKKYPFYMGNWITKSMWTKRLIKTYWAGEIKGDD